MSIKTYEWPVLVWRAAGKNCQMLAAPFALEVDGVRFVIPEGYDDFDGASIPRWLWNSVGHPFMREFVRAGLIHDYIYGEPDARASLGLPSDPDAARARTDELFYIQLRVDGVPVPKAKRMRWAVERFGASRFRGPGFIAKTLDQIQALDHEDCNCARDEIKAILANPDPDKHDSELLAGLAGINWTRIRELMS